MIQNSRIHKNAIAETQKTLHGIYAMCMSNVHRASVLGSIIIIIVDYDF